MVVATIAISTALLSSCYVSVTTGYGAGNLRAGWFNGTTTLTPSLVSSGTFGEMWNANVTGQVYAQPVVDNGTVVAVTEANHIYGFNETSGTQTWHRQVGVPFDPERRRLR